jgi:hypothetical protein
MAEAMAWIVHLDGRLCVAMGEHEMVHFIEHPVCKDIPQGAFGDSYVFCRRC